MSDVDSILIRNLSLPHAVLAPNVWGEIKAQPALLSLDLQLGAGFGSAANGDRLDGSTVHYGILAKRIRGEVREGMSVEQVLQSSFAAVEGLGKAVLAACEIRVRLPKGAMLGDAIVLVERRAYGVEERTARKMELIDVRVPVLIGVNGYERTLKQPLVFQLTIELRDEDVCKKLFNVEKFLVQAIQDTSFETLETLAEFTVKRLREQLLDQVVPGGKVSLRIAKPMAIAFADAPAVQVTRTIPGLTKSVAWSTAVETGNVHDFHRASLSQLTITKPYTQQ